MSGACLDHDLIKQLASLVEKLTTSGSPSLDTQLMKKFKKICKSSDLYVEHAYRLLMTQLNKQHSEIRLSCSQIVDELFNRSHIFRELILTDFQNFLELTVETDQQYQPLPPPKAAANKLKTDTLKAVQQWREKFGEAYKKLTLGYNYLQHCKHVNFNDIRARSHAEQRRREQEELRKQKALAAKLEKVRKEISELQKEITDTVTEAESCVDLLLPKPDSLFNQSDFTPAEDVVNDRVPNTNSHLESSVSSTQHEANSSKSPSCVPDSSRDDGVNNSEDHTSASKHDGIQVSGQEKEELRPGDLLDTDGKVNDLLCAGSTGTPQTKKSIEVCDVDGEINDDDGDEDIGSSDEDFEDVDADDAEERGLVQTHGLGSRKYNLEIEIETDEVHLKETEDNRDLFSSLRDSSCLITVRYLPQVVKWLEVLSKTGGSEAEIKSLIDLKQRLEHVKSQCAELRLIPQPDASGKLSDSDNDMEEVPEKEGYEPVIPAHLRAEYGLEATPSSKSSAGSSSSASSTATKVAKSSRDQKRKTSDPPGTSGDVPKSSGAQWTLTERSKAVSIQDPTSRAANLKKLGLKDDVRPSTSKDKPATATSTPGTSGEGEEAVPTLSFGPDLAYWGAPEKMEAPTIVKNDSLHRFWTPVQVENEKPSQNDIAVMMNRTFHYTGQFVPVKWKCRAKLPSGKLCERMDRVKCPFHGKIIARDENGVPANPSNIQTDSGEPAIKTEPTESTGDEKGEIQPWLDADLQEEIEAATGHDLGSQRSRAKAKASGSKGKGKGKGKGKKKYGGLTDISSTKATSRARLEAKVFNKGALKRVAAALDAADYKRVRDKFGNNFNYAHSK